MGVWGGVWVVYEPRELVGDSMGGRPRRLLTSSSARLGPLGGPQDVVARQGYLLSTLMKASSKDRSTI